MEQTLRDKILEIKKSLRLAMNGVVSSLQRKQGLDYKINFGVEIPRLKVIAAQYNPNRDLALALWQENIRESKILAILLMPSSEFTADDAQTWIAEAPFTEIADQLSMRLLCNIPNAPHHCVEWIEKDEAHFPYCGLLTLSHLFRQGAKLDEATERRYLTSVANILSSENGNKVLQNCAYASIQKFCETEDNYKKIKSSSSIRSRWQRAS